ncbi:hypothetical protein AB0G64_05195 [Streptomyces longwoodensis]
MGRGAGGADGGPVVALKFLPTAGLAPRQARGLVRLLDSVVLHESDHP